MNREFIPVALSGIKPGVEQHLASLPGVIDSFLEEHFLASNHYLIQQNGETAGFASIHGQTLITQFSLDEPFRKFGQERFRQLRAMEKVQSAFVPTFDDFFLAHALDDYRQLEKQAYFFRPAPWSMRSAVGWHWTQELARSADAGFIRSHTGDFFDDLERRIESEEAFFTLRQGNRVGMGLMVRSRFYADVASIGMYTIE